MGYTHYWTQLRSFTAAEWTQVLEDVGAILAHVQQIAEITLGDGMGERGSKPELTADCISFNGWGDDSHETFAIDRKRPPKEPYQRRAGGNFCKTARKPYDLAVTAVLCYLDSFHRMDLDSQRKPCVEVHSDGQGRDFLAGLDAAKAALPHLGNVLDLPMGVMEDDRWCAPWPYSPWDEPVGYSFHFCVDGHAYIIRDRTGEPFRFHTHEHAAEWARSYREKGAGRFRASHYHAWQTEDVGPLFSCYGGFDQARHKRIARQQREAFRYMVDVGIPERGDRGIQPPAYVRPGELLPELPRVTLSDLRPQEAA